jgi:PAS domain S-box-containing protein
MPEPPIPPLYGQLEPHFLRAVLETLDLGRVGLTIVAVDVDPPEYLFASPGAAELLGYTVDEFVRIPIWDLFPAETLAVLRERHKARAGAPPGTSRFEVNVTHRNGSKLPLEVTTTRVIVQGRPANVTFMNDISSRTEALRALAASEARFRTLVESAPDGVVILRRTTLSYLNSAAAAMLGFARPEDAIGHSITALLSPADAERAETRIEQLQRTQRRFEQASEYKSRRHDGREIIVEISSMPIEFEGAPATLAFARDITERKAMHEKMVQADRLAAVGTLAAGIAHEINNPLAYMLLGLQYLERELPKAAEDQQKMHEMLTRIAEIRSGAERVGGIVSGLKMFARADEVDRGRVNLEAVVDAAAKIADNEIRHRARLVRTYEMNALVHGNAARLEQVFLNLLVNAAHAVSDQDPATSEIRIRIRHDGPNSVIAEVTDNGPGIEPAVLARVFDPFYTTKPIGIGTGLGLPICRSIVEGFGGRVDLESEPGKGTTARVTLPGYVEGMGPTRAEARSAPSTVPPPDRAKILVVDDEPLVANLLGRLLSGEHDVTIATSAVQALSLVETTAFDAIVCDVMMPVMTGMDFYAKLQESAPSLAEKIVFVTGGAFVPRVADFLTRVPNPKLDKPLNLKELLATLRAVMGRAPE